MHLFGFQENRFGFTLHLLNYRFSARIFSGCVNIDAIVVLCNIDYVVAHALLNHVYRKGSGNRSDAHSMSQEETDMEFAGIIIVSNVLMAVFIYIVVSKIWQD